MNITSSLKFAFNIKLEEQGILDKTEKARGNMMTVFQKKKKQNIKKEEESSFIFSVWTGINWSHKEKVYRTIFFY